MPKNPVTAADKARVLDLHAKGLTRNDIVRETGRSGSTVSGIIAAAGKSFDRSQTEAATKARKADNASKRAQLESDLLSDAQRLRKQLWEPCRWGSFGGSEHTYNSVELDQPTFEQQRAITNSVGNVIDRAIKLAQVGTPEGQDHARSLLTDLGQALGIKQGES